ncbi:phage tail-collar fiber domain-containing protein [Nitratidesulfovibrio vulgaris]|uniref:Tail fiber protein, putative n=1 Tax=Nitratidesulfovibrio vulgaris (strain ATCC 29579 / DSM 644 / CCUG 34227 / NCIMB 8303 / VKM B-1760 / Hildenborough) TaxID=882 RepID=Q72D31_NITV2|nr:phage tail protein [Nitratidesulfovibrio vulgaris]AAS95580.1 tail fiber protein, putative [Nitratidesulfovibrio vulgaris str. Hildenborough]ADP86182.1 tail fiber protein, putative [Nitratidesulfovibrio vulgaris RCH1]
MANELQGMWTAKGLEKLARHAAGGTALMLRELALGDGGGSPAPAPAPSWTALTRQVWRGMVNGVQTSPDNASQVQVDAVIPLNIGGFFIREWGLYDAEGDMVAVGAHAEFYKPVISSGASAEIVERILLPIANAGAITLTIASQAVATQQFVQAQVKAHDESPTAHGDMVRRLEEHTHPHATEDAAGLVERATDAEAQAGTDGERYVTPKQLADALNRVSGMPVGMPFWWPGTTPPAGSLAIHDGPLLQRAAYPQLWAMAQASGNIITESEWQAQAAVQSSVGAFSSGDGATTFRCPRMRDFARGADPSGGRPVGAWQRASRISATVLYEGGSPGSGLRLNVGDLDGQQTVSTSTANSSSPTTQLSVAEGRMRPPSVSWLPCIKAFDTAINAAQVDMAVLAASLAGKVDRSDWVELVPGKAWKLPNGLIVQISNTGPVGNGTYVTYPVAFPSEVLGVFLSCSVGQQSGVTQQSWVHHSLAQFIYYSINTAAASYPINSRFLAIGR